MDPLHLIPLEETIRVDDTRVFASKQLCRRLLEDKRLVNDVLKAFIQDLPRYSAEIVKAAEKKDLASLMKKAHALKGLAGNVSMPLLQRKSQHTGKRTAKGQGRCPSTAWSPAYFLPPIPQGMQPCNIFQ